MPVAEEVPSPDRGGRTAFALIGGATVIVALAIVALVIALGHYKAGQRVDFTVK